MLCPACPETDLPDKLWKTVLTCETIPGFLHRFETYLAGGNFIPSTTIPIKSPWMECQSFRIEGAIVTLMKDHATKCHLIINIYTLRPG